MTLRSVALTLAACAIATVVSAAQAPPPAPPQVRDAARTFAVAGTATVSGTVVVDDRERTPLRRALVTLTRAGIEDIRTTSSDDQGRFVFTELPAGTYTLSASRGGFISMSHGAPKPGMPGQPINLRDREAKTLTPVALTRGAVIAGRVVDQAGRPIPAAAVAVSQFVTVNGVRRRRQGTGVTGTVATNEHGEYRIFGLIAGEYVIAVTPPALRTLSDVSAAEIAWAREPKGGPPPVPRPWTNAPTIFPGVADPAAAVPVSLEPGEERLGVDVTVPRVPVALLSGTIIGLDGSPAVNAFVERALRSAGEFSPGYTAAVQTDAGGRFSLAGVPPGEWVIRARAEGVPGAPLWGEAAAVVTGSDVPGIAIQLQPAMTISGRLVARGAATAHLDLSRARVQALPVDAGPQAFRPAGSQADAAGRFRVDGVLPGRYRLSVSGFPAPWSAQSAMLGDVDLLDVPFDVRPNASLAGVTVTIADVRTELSGLIRDAANQPVSNLYVLVFAVDRAHWGVGSRRVSVARASDDGAYSIVGLPPGEYHLCALTEIDPARQASDPSYFEELVPASIKITLGDGEKRRQDLRAGG
jgi:hypothetical protein